MLSSVFKVEVWRLPFSTTKSGDFAEQPRRQLRYAEQRLEISKADETPAFLIHH